MVTTNQKPMLDTQKSKRNPSITLKMVIKSQENRTKEEERNKKDKNKAQTINRMATRTHTYQ